MSDEIPISNTIKKEKNISIFKKIVIDTAEKVYQRYEEKKVENLYNKNSMYLWIGGILLFFVFVIVNFVAHSFHQKDIVKNAIYLHKNISCREKHQKTLVLCIPLPLWNNAGKEVQKAWIEGEEYITYGYNHIIIADEKRHLIVQVSIQEKTLSPSSIPSLKP